MLASMKKIFLVLLAAFLMTSCALDSSGPQGPDARKDVYSLPVFVNSPASARSIVIGNNGTNSEVGKYYLYTQAPALMSFRDSQNPIPEKATVQVYDTAVAITVSTEGTDTIFEGTNEDLIYKIVLHKDGSLDYRQAAKVRINATNGGEPQTNDYVSVVEGVGMKVDADGNITGGFQSWNIMQINGGTLGQTAMEGEVRSKGKLYAVANVTMKGVLPQSDDGMPSVEEALTPQPSTGLPSVEEAFSYDIAEKTEGMMTIGHPYQIGWTDGSVFDSFEYNNSATGGSETPSGEERCEELNQKIQEIFKDSKWQIDFIEDSGTVSLPVEALPQA